MRHLTYVLALAILFGCTHQSEKLGVMTLPPDPEVEQIATSYANLTLMTPHAVFVDPVMAYWCQAPSEEHIQKAREKSGPHAHTAVKIFMNDLAATSFKQGAEHYPVGSVIVKEKQALWYRADGREVKLRDGVGGMIKRQKGYDPEHGDWEYFYFEDVASITSGKIATCIECHTGAANRDCVYGGWADKSRLSTH